MWNHRSPNWLEAVGWYDKVLKCEQNSDNENVYSVDPDYLIQARLAELYRSGGNGLIKDPQRSGDLYTEAAESAMSAMKGKLSNKYFMLAEESWAELEDWLIFVCQDVPFSPFKQLYKVIYFI